MVPSHSSATRLALTIFSSASARSASVGPSAGRLAAGQLPSPRCPFLPARSIICRSVLWIPILIPPEPAALRRNSILSETFIEEPVNGNRMYGSPLTPQMQGPQWGGQAQKRAGRLPRRCGPARLVPPLTGRELVR
jgi:hypothetical protein